jgi:hypothetical protein
LESIPATACGDTTRQSTLALGTRLETLRKKYVEEICTQLSYIFDKKCKNDTALTNYVLHQEELTTYDGIQ